MRKETLSHQIRKSIGLRVIACLILYIVLSLGITAYDLFNGIKQIGSREKQLSSDLSEQIISQILINNSQSIPVILKGAERINNVRIKWQRESQKTDGHIRWLFPLSWEYSSNIAAMDGRQYGAITFHGSFLCDSSFIYGMVVRICLFSIFLIMLFFSLYPLFSKVPRVLFINPLMDILNLLQVDNNDKNQNVATSFPLCFELNQIKLEIKALLDKATKRSKDVVAGKIASQVAHDIRSPLAVLKVIFAKIKHLEGEEKKIMLHAMQRIRAITDDLLDHQTPRCIRRNYAYSNLVFPLIESVFLEKKLEVSHKIKVCLDVSDEFYAVSSAVEPMVFCRIISNVLNNSIEAIAGEGAIKIKLYVEGCKLYIVIQDDGCGIPESVINDVFEHRFSHGKEEGSGLGLSLQKQKYSLGVERSLLIPALQQAHVCLLCCLRKTKHPAFSPVFHQWRKQHLLF